MYQGGPGGLGLVKLRLLLRTQPEAECKNEENILFCLCFNSDVFVPPTCPGGPMLPGNPGAPGEPEGPTGPTGPRSPFSPSWP